MENLIKILFVKQSKTEFTKLGRKYQLTRFNPWNPFSYFVLIILFVATLFAYGFSGVNKFKNPFKYS